MTKEQLQLVNAHSRPGQTETAKLAEANKKIRAKSPAAKAERIAEIEAKLEDAKGALLAVVKRLNGLKAVVLQQPAAKAEAPERKDNQPFWKRSPSHRAAWIRMYKRNPPE